MHGQCEDFVNSYRCDCSGTGFTGNQCQHSKFCQNIENEVLLILYSNLVPLFIVLLGNILNSNVTINSKIENIIKDNPFQA